jgi:hypothetical protein
LNFAELSAQLSRFRDSPEFRDESAADAEDRLAILESRVALQSRLIERLEAKADKSDPPSLNFERYGDPDDSLLADLARLSSAAFDRKENDCIECGFQVEYSMVGMIAFLGAKAGGNVMEKGVVEITAKSCFSEKARDSVKNLANLTEDSRFCSEDAPGQWVCYDFKNANVGLTHYSVRGCYNGIVDGTNLKNWVLEGSDDGIEWIEFDRQEENEELNGPDMTASFEIGSQPPVKMVRLRMTGKNHCGNDRMIISAIEFFGSILW